MGGLEHGEASGALASVLLVTPVWKRFDLTRIMLEERRRTFDKAKLLGVDCECVCIGDDANLDTAERLGFVTIEAPNQLGRRYNDGHEYAVREGFDFSFQCNSDQVFEPELLVAIAQAPRDKFIATRWLTAIHRNGKKAVSYRNPLWSMRAYPIDLLRRAPRPCAEDIMSGCDRSAHEGAAAANRAVPLVYVEHGPLETIQFESDVQVTPWARNQKIALMNGKWETAVPWDAIGQVHGVNLVREMQKFYEERAHG